MYISCWIVELLNLKVDIHYLQNMSQSVELLSKVIDLEVHGYHLWSVIQFEKGLELVVRDVKYTGKEKHVMEGEEARFQRTTVSEKKSTEMNYFPLW